MSEIKVNKIEPAAGSEVTIAAQVLGVPGTDPNHFATVSQLGGGGAGGISRAQAQDLVDIGVAAANRHSDEQDELQNTQIALDIATAKTDAITETKNYSDANNASTLLQANAYTDSRTGVPTWTSETDLGIGSILIVRSATVNGNSDYSHVLGSSISGIIKYGGNGRYNYNGSGTEVSGTWIVLCWSSDDSGNPSSQFLAQRIS